MEVKLAEDITVAKVIDGFVDHGDGGVLGYSGRLDIRPPFQREMVYSKKEQQAVVESAIKGYPLNVMYWSQHEDGRLEVLDGQQRTLSLARFFAGEFEVTVNGVMYLEDTLPDETREALLEYPLTVYICTGDADEKLEWFRVINIAGKVLTAQEVRNAMFAGTWAEDAKRYFCRPNGPAVNQASGYINADPLRQGYLEVALSWLCGSKKDEELTRYMREHQHEKATELQHHFGLVVNWVKSTFQTYRPYMKGINWGALYRQHGSKMQDANELERRIQELEANDEVTNHKGIHAYVLSGDERHLSLRKFSKAMKARVLAKQEYRCAHPKCKKENLSTDQVEADHIKAWHAGGRTVEKNCQVLCKEHNRAKGGST